MKCNYYVYEIKSKNPFITKKYIGITKHFTIRKTQHKSDCNNVNSKRYNFKLYQYIRLNNGFDNFNINLIRIVNIEPSEKGIYEKIEFELNNGFENCLNERYPNRTAKQSSKNYYDNNKAKFKLYYQNNKEIIKERFLKRQQNLKNNK